ncbi:prepilin-type N-terminal cleavage/methylation domain-containing protein [Amylibacter sp. SFDW26]|uniref:type IV pilus modification PilV family protein n=1 Tax=Amylibacter sp. SFDW26 TaxID=2652722 RepID=UPI00186A7A9C|nr:prepilin-type N-terminal cleavage/methylation domain-containing protein [Amylibacter sp. SFDW26]
MSLRHKEKGFSLLETLVAFALATMVLAIFYKTTGVTLTQSHKALSEHQRLQLAESILDEYLIVPDTALKGRFDGRWEWQISTSIVEGLPQTKYDRLVRIEEVSITVSEVSAPSQKTTLSTERIVRK